MKIALHIERLVLDGLPLRAGQAGALQAALEAELARLLAEPGMTGVHGGAAAELAVAPVRLAADGGPHRWGRQIAGSLHGGLIAPAAASAPNPVRPHSLP